MKQATVHSKLPRGRTAVSMRRPIAGPNGISIAPPAYGIDFVDRQQSRSKEMPIQRQAHEDSGTPERQQENRTGLPDHLKTGIETLSGLSLDDVHVHYNSTKPATLQALAYTQGTDIHVAPGQEQHLPHEAWHVVQQAQGRVRNPFGSGIVVVQDRNMEAEADHMGLRAAAHNFPVQAAMSSSATETTAKITLENSAPDFRHPVRSPAIQCLPYANVRQTPGYVQWDEDDTTWHINVKLGESKKGREIYHVTNEQGDKKHYFFSVKDGEFRDEVGNYGRRGTQFKFSKLPQGIQNSATALWALYF